MAQHSNPDMFDSKTKKQKKQTSKKTNNKKTLKKTQKTSNLSISLLILTGISVQKIATEHLYDNAIFIVNKY